MTTVETPKTKRHYRSREWWQAHITACDKSGLSRKSYCELHGLTLSSLSGWYTKLKPKDVRMSKAADFIKLSGEPADQPSKAQTVDIGCNGVTLRIENVDDAQALKPWIQMLRSL